MPILSELRLVNGSTGDPCLYLDFPGADNAILFDAGENQTLSRAMIQDIAALLLSHHHPDHLSGLARVIRYTTDTDKEVAVFGPVGTIDRFEQQLRAVQWPRFDFMKVRYLVTELGDHGEPRTAARFARQVDFAREELPAPRARGSLLLETPEFRIRYAVASHTAPCLSYAVEVKSGYQYDRVKATGRPLRPGRWTAAVRRAMRRPVKDRPETLEVAGGQFGLRELVRDYFVREPLTKIAFVTDTRRDEATYDGLVELVRGAQRLYCDAYYMDRQAKAALKHGHLTAPEAAQLAADAEVEQLWLMHLGPRYRGRFDALVAEARAAFPDTFAVLPAPDEEAAADD